MTQHKCKNCNSSMSMIRVDTEKFITGEYANTKTLRFWYCTEATCRYYGLTWLDQELININIAEAFFRIMAWLQEHNIIVPKEVLNGNKEETQHRSGDPQSSPQIDVGGPEARR